MTSLDTLIQGASIPELKEALRQFEARCPRSNELSQMLLGLLESKEKNSKAGLRRVVEGVCESFEECGEIVRELLGDEDEFPGRSCILNFRSGEEGDSENEATRRKSKQKGKRKRDLLSSPLKRKEMKTVKNTHQDESALLPPEIPSGWPNLSMVQNKNRTSSSSSAAPPKRKRIIGEIFEADRQRRELEAQQEAERRRHEREIQARCAQCKAFFLTDDNWHDSCVFHSGE
jgi:hypothetical protein